MDKLGIANNIKIITDEIYRIENETAKLKSMLASYEISNAENKIMNKIRIEYDLSSAASRIREQSLLKNRSILHLLKATPRTYSIIKLSSVIGKNFCEFDVVENKLNWNAAIDFIKKEQNE